MTTTDLIAILLPIFAEGIIIFLFQLFINRKLNRIDKKIEIKDNVILTFYNLVMEVKIEAQKTFNAWEISSLEQQQRFWDLINPLMYYYNANQYDLYVFEKEFHDFYHNWILMADYLRDNSSSNCNNETLINANRQLQKCDQYTDRLIKVIREKL